jgi:nucleoside-diphosphate-sugar epimerase
MIAVTGANGKLGSRVIQHLLKRMAASEIVACVRKPEDANDLVAEGVLCKSGFSFFISLYAETAYSFKVGRPNVAAPAVFGQATQTR